MFDFTVQVRDKGIPSRMAELTAKIKIFVNDVNDSPPTFENSSYNATVLLPTYVGVLVTTVKAHDPDSEAVSELKYKVTSGNADRKFAIDEITGAITIRDSQNLKDRYDLMIHVSDGVYAAKTRVIINLESMPITGLRFGQEDYYANVMENSSEASTVAVVNVIGTDLNEHVVFRILNPEGLFQIGETSGVLRTTGVPFDREVKDEYEIVVEAQSQYDTSKKAHALVHVNVMDVNDNRPIFMDLPYYAVVPMSAKKGDLVFKVRTTTCFLSQKKLNYTVHSLTEKNVFFVHR